MNHRAFIRSSFPIRPGRAVLVDIRKILSGQIHLSWTINDETEEMTLKRKTILIDGVRYYADRPRNCRGCYFWKNRKAGCTLGKENCYYLAESPKKKSPCDGCCYAPCIGVCMKKCMNEVLKTGMEVPANA